MTVQLGPAVPGPAFRGPASTPSVRRRVPGGQLLAAIALCCTLSACGFALRGTTELPFHSIHINLPANSQFGAQMRRQIRAASPTTAVIEDASQAEARLQVLENSRSRTEVALNAQGRVQEYELQLRLTFQVIDAQANILVPPTTLTAVRTLPYDDNVAQAKESEAEALYQSMQSGLAQRILHQLNAANTRAAAERAEAERSKPLPPVQ